MRFLHTADWHLGRILHGVHLTGDQAHLLDQVVDLAREAQVEAVIVAGDVYDRAVPPPDAVALLSETLGRLIRGVGVRVAMVTQHAVCSSSVAPTSRPNDGYRNAPQRVVRSTSAARTPLPGSNATQPSCAVGIKPWSRILRDGMMRSNAVAVTIVVATPSRWKQRSFVTNPFHVSNNCRTRRRVSLLLRSIGCRDPSGVAISRRRFAVERRRACHAVAFCRFPNTASSRSTVKTPSSPPSITC